jgi:hypothetical protein
MMLSDVRANSSSRLLQTRQFLDFIHDNTPPPPAPTPFHLINSRGLFFVQLYGVYEKTIINSVFRSITFINSNEHRVLDFKPLVLSMVLHPQCDALASVSARKWEKRWELFEKLELNPIVNICEEVLPTDGQNIRYRQLEMIWKTFCIDKPVLPRPEIRGRISELVDNRNAIAHGDATALDIGSRVTTQDLYIKYSDISEYCSYFLDTLESHILTKAYLLKGLD